ncbi:hypothetical protein CALVIDRAFT_541887 [Calocera viscosa TUFC12733]|uniref:F-box domain-containing protein n=1 Tax=Calocera viscosa (strain TUFC12733) TaxID=1330018 RepID=A0A167H8T4_CALVF|nr:hypothetical protein CALVIDRAFT_541887 [Calocera viscosa TUFC12733]
MQDLVSICDGTLRATLSYPRYAPFIKTLATTYEDSLPEVGNTLRSSFFLYQSELQLSTSLRLPNLREISVSTSGALLVRWLMELAPPSLEKLNFEMIWRGLRDRTGDRNDSLEYLSQFLRGLPRRTPALKVLSLDIPDGILGFLQTHLSNIVRGLPLLEDVDLRFPIPAEALPVMEGWTSLSRLKLRVFSPEGPCEDISAVTASLPALQSLSVSGSTMILSLILQNGHFPSLRALDFPRITLDDHLDRLNELLVIVAERFPRLHNVQLQAPPAQAAWSPTAIILDPLHSLLDLRHFSLKCEPVHYGYCSAQLNDKHIRQLSRAWTRLESLDLRTRTTDFRRGNVCSQRPSFSLRGLLPLAQSCQHLRQLFIGVDLTLSHSEYEASALTLESFELECISIPPRTQAERERAYKLISVMWPNVRMSTEGEMDDRCDPELKRFCAAFNSLWAKER